MTFLIMSVASLCRQDEREDALQNSIEKIRQVLKEPIQREETKAKLQNQLEYLERRLAEVRSHASREKDLKARIERLEEQAKEAEGEKREAIMKEMAQLKRELESSRQKEGGEGRPGKDWANGGRQELEALYARYKLAETDEARAEIMRAIEALQKEAGRKFPERAKAKPGRDRSDLQRDLEDLESRLHKGVPEEERGALAAKRDMLLKEMAMARQGVENRKWAGEMAPQRRDGRNPVSPYEKLEQESLALGRRIQSTGDEKERASLKEELRNLLDHVFDMKEADRRQQVEDLSRQLESLRSMLKVRQENREKIIDKRMRQLSGEADEWDW